MMVGSVRGLGLTGASPRVIALERLIESEYVREVEPRIVGLADKQPEVDEREYHVSDIGRRAYAPVVEYETRHHAEPVEGKVATRFRQLAAGDVSAFRQP